MKIKKIIFILVTCLLCGILFHKYFFKRWSFYYQDKLYKAPRPLLIKALNIFDESLSNEKKALDLGAGVGNDTLYLLQNGWTVWANDREEEAINILTTRPDIQEYKNKLTLIKSDFIHLSWDTLPTFNLIYAGYSLPFVNKSNFYTIWKQLIQKLEPNGIIVVHLFGYNHEGFNWWDRRNMTFFTREEVVDLLRDLTIELLEETCEPNERTIMDHTFSIIGMKL